MKNTLTDLNNYLFETLERLTDDSLTDDELDKEILRSKAVTNVAETIIQNGHLALSTMKHMDNMGYEGRKNVPAMLESK